MHFNFYDASHQLHHCSILLKHDIGDKHYILFMDENNGDEVISARIDDEGHLFHLTNGEMEEMQDIFARYLHQDERTTDHCHNCVCDEEKCPSCEDCPHASF